MAKTVSRFGDTNSAGGQILKSAQTVFCENKPVGLHPSPITPHFPYLPEHASSVTIDASPNVFAEYQQVLRTSSATSCGHPINTGAANVFIS